MTDYINTIKSLEAQIKRLQAEDVKIRQLLFFYKIKCRKSTAYGVVRLLNRMDKARKLLK